MDQKLLKDVETLNKNLSEAKKNVAVLEGRENEIMKTLQSDFGIKTYAGLEKQIKEGQEQEAKLETEIQGIYNKIKEQYQW